MKSHDLRRLNPFSLFGNFPFPINITTYGYLTVVIRFAIPTQLPPGCFFPRNTLEHTRLAFKQKPSLLIGSIKLVLTLGDFFEIENVLLVGLEEYLGYARSVFDIILDNFYYQDAESMPLSLRIVLRKVKKDVVP